MKDFPAWPRLTCLVSVLPIVLYTELCIAQSGAPDPAAAASQRVIVRGTETREYDWAKLQVNARVVYISSGPRTLTGRMIDNDLGTVFRFSASDTSPTVIVELAQTVQIDRVSAAFSAEDARVNVYLLNEIPKDPGDLRFAAATATIVDPPQDHGIATVNFAANNARYVALRWIRNKSNGPFEVAEISAFSHAPTDLEIQLASNSGPNFAATEPPLVPIVSP
jgi:hypothetical protein